MEPDREDRSPAHAWLREAWRQRSLATGAQIRMTSLPGRLSEAQRLVDELAH